MKPETILKLDEVKVGDQLAVLSGRYNHQVEILTVDKLTNTLFVCSGINGREVRVRRRDGGVTGQSYTYVQSPLDAAIETARARSITSGVVSEIDHLSRNSPWRNMNSDQCVDFLTELAELLARRQGEIVDMALTARIARGKA